MRRLETILHGWLSLLPADGYYWCATRFARYAYFHQYKGTKKDETSPGLALWDSNEYYYLRSREMKTPGW